MNGERVGVWSRTASDVSVLTYDDGWLDSPHARPLSLTLPFLPGNAEHRGNHVAAWFENLLPDNEQIRQRIARRFRTATNARSLLAELGRDCVGAVQILSLDETPTDSGVLDMDPLTDADVARALRGVTSDGTTAFGDRADDAFRISIAGAQEKTALLRRDGQWYRPRGATPTTHILKLPLGLVGNMRLDLAHSVANEWLCLRLLTALGFDVANAEMATFTDVVSSERVLIVERFDRQWRDGRRGLIRLPQEDLCQATGTAPARKYESDGGPGIPGIVQLLRGGLAPDDDVQTFVLTQLAFWLLAAIDGHAKNFSIFLRRDGYLLTPLYDVISAWPIIGRGPNAVPVQQAKLAMAIRCKHPHYEMQRISVRHWRCLAEQSGVPFAMLEDLVQRVPVAIDSLATQLPPDFPEAVWGAITRGLLRHMERFNSGLVAGTSTTRFAGDD